MPLGDEREHEVHAGIAEGGGALDQSALVARAQVERELRTRRQHRAPERALEIRVRAREDRDAGRAAVADPGDIVAGGSIVHGQGGRLAERGMAIRLVDDEAADP